MDSAQFVGPRSFQCATLAQPTTPFVKVGCVLSKGTPRATAILAQCLFRKIYFTQPPIHPRVRVEFAGSSALLGSFPYQEDTTIASLLDQLALRLLGHLGETFVTFGLSKKPYPDQPPHELYEEIDRAALLSSIEDKTREKKRTICLQLIMRPHPSNEERIRIINLVLQRKLSQTQKLRTLEIIGQIPNQKLRNTTLMNNIDHFLNDPYLEKALEILALTTHIYVFSQFRNTIVKKLTYKNEVDKALKIAMGTTSSRHLSRYATDCMLQIIISILVEKDELVYATQIADLLPTPSLQDRKKYIIIAFIGLQFIRKNGLKKAFRSNLIWKYGKAFMMYILTSEPVIFCTLYFITALIYILYLCFLERTFGPIGRHRLIARKKP